MFGPQSGPGLGHDVQGPQQPQSQPSAIPPPPGQQGPGSAPPPIQAPVPRTGPPLSPEAERAREALTELRSEVAKAVVGQETAVTSLVICLLCRGHILLEGVPGTAKTLLVRAFSKALSIETARIQFTPDLMPGDITGSLIYDSRSSEFTFREGPVFTNLLLADEINRTPPKTQSALLEAMEERQITIDGDPRKLPEPFIVAATQNPVEFEGTYPLPEAQLDRFLMKIRIDLPERAAEIEVLNRHAAGFDPRDLDAAGLKPVASADDLSLARKELEKVQIHPQILAYIVDIVRASRTSPSLALGVSPRGATAIMNTARAWAWLSGRNYVTPDDVKALAFPTLRHRVSLRAEAELDGASADSVIESILATVPVPR